MRKEIKEFNDPARLALLAGMKYFDKQGDNYFIFNYFNQDVKLTYPELIAYENNTDKKISIGNQAVICYYCYSILESSHYVKTNEWISFSELKDGRIYAKAFQGYTGDQLAKHASELTDNFQAVKSLLHAELLEMGDFAFKINVLPNVAVALVLWKEDDEFPASCRLLFNDNVNAYLPTDACAIVGSMFTHKVINITSCQ